MALNCGALARTSAFLWQDVGLPRADERCYASYVRSGFLVGITDYDRFGEWMTNETVMQLAQAGECERAAHNY